MRKIFFIFISFFMMSCSDRVPEGFDLPDDCNGRCETAFDTQSFKDAVVNSTAGFSDCICVTGTGITADVTVLKPLKMIGKNDGSSKLTKLTVSKTDNVLVSNIHFSGIPAVDAAVNIFESSVRLENVTISNISAGSLYGGRGIVISGGRSVVEISGVNVKNTDGTGLLVNGEHDVAVMGSSFNDCGFAGIWVQNDGKRTGKLKITDSSFENNAAVAIEVLGQSSVEIFDSNVRGVSSREVASTFVSDAVVIKNGIMSSAEKTVNIKNTALEGFERAALILDAQESGEVKGVVIEGLKVASVKGEFGLVVQNGVEPSGLRKGIIENPFTENDISLDSPLFIITTPQTAE